MPPQSRDRHRDYMRAYRADKKGQPVVLRSVAPSGGDSVSVEAAVRSEIDLLGMAGEMPGQAALAVALARVMDNPELAHQFAPTAARLHVILLEIRRASAARVSAPVSKLAALRSSRA
jgi:hypothetical protein